MSSPIYHRTINSLHPMTTVFLSGVVITGVFTRNLEINFVITFSLLALGAFSNSEEKLSIAKRLFFFLAAGAVSLTAIHAINWHTLSFVKDFYPLLEYLSVISLVLAFAFLILTRSESDRWLNAMFGLGIPLGVIAPVFWMINAIYLLPSRIRTIGSQVATIKHHDESNNFVRLRHISRTVSGLIMWSIYDMERREDGVQSLLFRTTKREKMYNDPPRQIDQFVIGILSLSLLVLSLMENFL